MTLRANNKKAGMVLPSLLTLTIILLMLASALLASGTTSLRVATHDQQSDQATYAAEAGLVKAAQEYVDQGSLPQPYERSLVPTGSKVIVTIYENPGSTEKRVAGLVIPKKSAYLLAEGVSENGTRRKSGALFRMGLEAFQVGALADKLVAENSDFDAYNSERESPGFSGPGYDPSAKVDDVALVASNTTSGTTFDLNNVRLDGGLYVGPGGDTGSQVVKTGTTSVGREAVLAESIDIDEIEVPGGDDGDEGDPQIPTLGSLAFTGVTTNGDWSFSDGGNLNFTVGPYNGSSQGGNVDAPAPLKTLWGSESVNGAQVPVLQVYLDVPGGAWAKILNDGSGTFFYKESNGTIRQGTSPDFESRIFGGGGGGGYLNSTTNPAQLDPGRYDSVTIDEDWTANFDREGGTYVIKDLLVKDSGHLKFLDGGKPVTIYVTNSLSVEGEDALLNASRLAPHLKVYYTGEQDVNLSGGANAFFTLIALHANISLKGPEGIRTQFFGALVGKDLEVKNAAFHYDTATSGIGTGTSGTSLSLLHRHRL